MAFSAKGNNVQPIFFSITFVVIVLSLLSAVGAGLGCDAREAMVFNCMINSFISFYSLWVFFGVLPCILVPSLFTFIGFFVTISDKPSFFRLVVEITGMFAFFGLSPYFIAYFTLVLIPVSSGFIFTEFFDWFSLIASITSLFNHLASFKQIKALYLSSCGTPIAAVTL